MLGTLAGAALGGLASGAASFGLSKLFGGDEKSATSSLQNFKPTGINAGGLSSTLENGNLILSPSAGRLGLVRGVSDAYGGEADEFAGLRGSIRPGFSDLRTSRLQEIENARQNAIGNLRENMARRRVAGSSFGQDALARAELEFGQAREKTQAESFLQELDATNQLIQQQYAARRGQYQTGLDDLNLTADIATKLAAGATAQMGANARLEAELTAKEQAAKGKFFGESVISPISKAVGSAVSGFKFPSFSSGGTGLSLSGTGGLY